METKPEFNETKLDDFLVCVFIGGCQRIRPSCPQTYDQILKGQMVVHRAQTNLGFRRRRVKNRKVYSIDMANAYFCASADNCVVKILAELGMIEFTDPKNSNLAILTNKGIEASKNLLLLRKI